MITEFFEESVNVICFVFFSLIAAQERTQERTGAENNVLGSGEKRRTPATTNRIGIGPPANDNRIPILGGSKWIDRENITRRNFQNIRKL